MQSLLTFAFLAGCLNAQSTLPTDIHSEADLSAARALKSAAIRTRSIRALLPRAEEMAAQWSSEAKLYGIIGKTPENKLRMEPETWTFYFGDPKARDGAFEVVFHNEDLYSRQGIKNGVLMREYFRNGAFEGRHTQKVDFKPYDYVNCRPVSMKFIDTVDLAENIHRDKIMPAELAQYRISLFHARNDQCDILGRMATLLTEKPILRKYQRRTLWVVTGAEESVFYRATNGKRLLRRSREVPSSPTY
jgi:hypothetical protein